MKVQIDVEIYQTDAVEESGLIRPTITVRNEGKYSDFVTLEVAGTRYQIVATEMIEAIQKASRC